MGAFRKQESTAIPYDMPELPPYGEKPYKAASETKETNEKNIAREEDSQTITWSPQIFTGTKRKEKEIIFCSVGKNVRHQKLATELVYSQLRIGLIPCLHYIHKHQSASIL